MKNIKMLIFTAGIFILMNTANAKSSVNPEFNDIDLVLLGNSRETYIIGENSQSYTAERTVLPFRMNKYETTYNLWYNVRIKAEKLGYNFQNPGQEGSTGRRGRKPTENGFGQPVTMINWYDAIVWCNALSETEGRTPCYTYKGTILRDSSDTAVCDLAECNWEADGYRLPAEAEWEYAARKTENGFQRGDLASGQTETGTPENDSRSEDDVAWYGDNTNMTHAAGTAGTPFSPDAPPAPGTGYANRAGLYDMSGNVLEYCWDWFADYTEQKPGTRATGPEYNSRRVSRGGSWSQYTGFIFAGDRYSFDPNETYNYMGFRFCTSSLK